MENNQVVEQPKKKASVKTILTIVGNVIFYAVIIALFLFSLMNINAGNGTQNFPNLFGKGMLSVQTNSMQRNSKETGAYWQAEWANYEISNIDAGDLVYDDVFNGDLSSLKVGDVITFYDKDIDNLNTHRIVYIGEKVVVCQGDYVVTTSQSDTKAFDFTIAYNEGKNGKLYEDGLLQLVAVENIKGKVTGVARGAGSVLDNIRQNWLFYFVIPVAVILLLEIIFVVKNFLDLRHEKNKAELAGDKEAMLAELEAEKEKMRQELLAELRAQQAAAPVNETPKVEEPLEDKVEEEVIEEVEEDSTKEE